MPPCDRMCDRIRLPPRELLGVRGLFIGPPGLVNGQQWPVGPPPDQTSAAARSTNSRTKSEEQGCGWQTSHIAPVYPLSSVRPGDWAAAEVRARRCARGGVRAVAVFRGKTTHSLRPHSEARKAYKPLRVSGGTTCLALLV